MENHEPSTNGLDGRGTNGKFLPGNRLGRGNPLGGKVAKLRAAMLRAAKVGDVQAVLAALLKKAKVGDVAAAKLYFAYTAGEPVPLDLIERLDRLEAVVLEKEES